MFSPQQLAVIWWSCCGHFDPLSCLCEYLYKLLFVRRKISLWSGTLILKLRNIQGQSGLVANCLSQQSISQPYKFLTQLKFVPKYASLSAI